MCWGQWEQLEEEGGGCIVWGRSYGEGGRGGGDGSGAWEEGTVDSIIAAYRFRKVTSVIISVGNDFFLNY